MNAILHSTAILAHLPTYFTCLALSLILGIILFSRKRDRMNPAEKSAVARAISLIPLSVTFSLAAISVQVMQELIPEKEAGLIVISLGLFLLARALDITVILLTVVERCRLSQASKL